MTLWRGAAATAMPCRHELFWTRSPSKPLVYGASWMTLAMVAASSTTRYPAKGRCQVFPKTGAKNIAHWSLMFSCKLSWFLVLKLSGGKCTPLHPYHRLRPCCSYILHTSDQRSHADFPSLPDASSHSSFISLISLSHTFLCCGAMTRMGRPYIISDFWVGM